MIIWKTFFNTFNIDLYSKEAVFNLDMKMLLATGGNWETALNKCYHINF